MKVIKGSNGIQLGLSGQTGVGNGVEGLNLAAESFVLPTALPQQKERAGELEVVVVEATNVRPQTTSGDKDNISMGDVMEDCAIPILCCPLYTLWALVCCEPCCDKN